MEVGGHKDIFSNYSQLRKLNEENGINAGKQAKFHFLKLANTYKNELAGGGSTNQPGTVRQNRTIINNCINRIQRDLNNGELNIEATIDNLCSALKADGDMEKRQKVAKFVNCVANLAKHNTESNTKLNWFGVTNRTAHIDLLLHGNNCTRYINENINRYGASEQAVSKDSNWVSPDRALEKTKINQSSIKAQLKTEISYQEKFKTIQKFFEGQFTNKFSWRKVPKMTHGEIDLALLFINELKEGTPRNQVVKNNKQSFHDVYRPNEDINHDSVLLNSELKLNNKENKLLKTLNAGILDFGTQFCHMGYKPIPGQQGKLEFNMIHPIITYLQYTYSRSAEQLQKESEDVEEPDFINDMQTTQEQFYQALLQDYNGYNKNKESIDIILDKIASLHGQTLHIKTSSVNRNGLN